MARSLLIYMGTPMVAAMIWTGNDIANEEIRLYRKIYRLPNTISNRAIQHITTQIRPAKEIVELLASRAWHMFKRQNRITEYYQRREVAQEKRQQAKETRPQRIDIPKGMADMMLATTKDSTSLNFGMGHHCEKHGTLFTTEHIDQCDQLLGC